MLLVLLYNKDNSLYVIINIYNIFDIIKSILLFKVYNTYKWHNTLYVIDYIVYIKSILYT